MRIISNFHDYYDGAMRQGMDKDVVYVREKKEILINRKYSLGYTHHFSRHYVRLHLFGYCGKIYHVYEIVNDEIGKTLKSDFYYDYETFKKEGLKSGAVSKYDVARRKWWPSDYDRFAQQSLSHALSIFHEYQVPIFLLSQSDKHNGQILTLNPRLKNLGFQKVKDVYTAYQDIFQYVSGVLNQPETKMVKITDKDKIHKHGFDKWSFRKLPTKKGKK
jgi:hypothetical protein